MDSNNTGPVNPDPNQPHPHDIAQPGPIDPATGQPDHGAEVTELKSWFRQNAASLLITAAVVAAVCTWLDPFGALLVVLGLGLVIFIHELGHFAAAKWCDVHVKTFSIGFGPAVPFCSYKWGETTYMVGIIPLGGYVQMVGEGETAEGDEEGEEDPRSFKKKSVGQRMVIISAGVVMNVILGMGCFVAAYLHGVQEIPAEVGRVESGGAAWRAGIKSDDEIVSINGLENPSFKDVPPAVMVTAKGEAIPIRVKRGGEVLPPMTVEPQRDEGQLFPQLGIGSPQHLTLPSFGKRQIKPVLPGTPAAEAKGADGQTFEPGDRVVAMSDQSGNVTGVNDFAEYSRRMMQLAGRDITFHVLRKGEAEGANPVAVTVAPAYRHTLGMRMRMGQVVAVREGGPNAGKIVPRSESPAKAGDRIKAVLLPPDADGNRVWYVNGSVFSEEKGKKDELKPEFQLPGLDAAAVKEKVKTQSLDPLLLPQQINQWADRQGGKYPELDLVVLREENHTEVAKRVPMTYDPAYRYAREYPSLPNSPLPVSGLGLAYWVEAIVDGVAPGGPAADATTAEGELPGGFWSRVKRAFGAEGSEVEPGGAPKPLQPGDVITAVRFKALAAAGAPPVVGEWKDDLKPHQWASADSAFQAGPPHEIDVRVNRNGEEFTVTLKGRPDAQFPDDERGLIFETDTRVRKAADIGDALGLGIRNTVRFIKTVYMNLYGLVFGRVSVKTMSGPLTIATTTYRLAEEDIWKLLLFLGMISVNLAVVNFLPIPVLDGGHMVFLILEKVLGRPVPERVFAIAMYVGLFLILGLMVLTLTNDVRREFF